MNSGTILRLSKKKEERKQMPYNTLYSNLCFREGLSFEDQERSYWYFYL